MSTFNWLITSASPTLITATNDGQSFSGTPEAFLAMLAATAPSSGDITEYLAAITSNTNGLLKNDMEVPFIWFGVKTGFTDTSAVPVEVLTTDIIVSYVILNTTSGAGTSYTKRWRGWLDVIIPSPLTDYLVPQGGMPLTLAQIQSLGLATQVTLNAVLTELQLKADLTETQPVGATARVCVAHQGITVPITTGVTLASLCSGAIIPVGAVTAEIQAQNGVVRYSLDASTVTPTSGKRINVDENCVIDSVLASVRVVAETAAVTCSVAFFDRV